MAGFGIVAVAGEGPAWPSAIGSARDGEWHSVAAADRRAVARYTGAVWELEQHLALLSPLVSDRHMGSGGDEPGRGDGRQSTSRYRLHHGPGPCIGRRRKRGTREQAFGRSRGGFTSKVHCIADAQGRPLAFHLTGGEAADCTNYEVLIDLTEATPAALLGDKGYDTDPVRADLKRRGIRAVIPPRSHRIAAIRWNKRLYRQRNRIERMLGHLKMNRAIATRYDKLAESFLGMLHLAAFRYCCRFVHST
jgi:transposase